MNTTAMREMKPGITEREIFGKVQGIALSKGSGVSFPIIFSVNGQLLHNHLHDNYSLQEIAKDVFSSPYHLCRVFKQITGLGINQYRNQIRLNKIYSILVKGTEDLSDLAFQFGYSSHSHLSHNFKQHFGFSPSTINSQ